MPYAYNGAVRVHYGVEGIGVSLVLVHGFSDTLECWHEFGYVEALSPLFQLILIDNRGHGGSDKPHDPAQYCATDFVGDVAAVLDALDVDQAHFLGYSMGARIGFAMARHAPHRLLSLGLGGMAPYSNPAMRAQFVALLAQGPQAFAGVWESQGPISTALRKRLLNIDVDALIAMQQHPDDENDEFINALSGLSCPFKLFAGDLDWSYAKILEFAEELPTGSLVTLPGLNHLQALERSDLLLPHLTSFLGATGH